MELLGHSAIDRQKAAERRRQSRETQKPFFYLSLMAFALFFFLLGMVQFLQE